MYICVHKRTHTCMHIYTYTYMLTCIYTHAQVITGCNIGVAHPPGYPTFSMLAAAFIRFLPFGSPAWRVNIMSALFGRYVCICVCGVYVYMYVYTHSHSYTYAHTCINTYTQHRSTAHVPNSMHAL